MHVELLKAARAAVKVYDGLDVDYDERPGYQVMTTPGWDAAILALKEAVDLYGEKL